MTPKEKADELFGKFYSAIPSDEMGENYQSAKQCALIAVDEILYVIENPDDRYSSHGLQLVRNWREVKKEIEKL
jgi:hypothetical protein